MVPPGLLLVGRSLRIVEQQETHLRQIVFLAWFLLVAFLLAGARFLSRSQPPPTPA